MSFQIIHHDEPLVVDNIVAIIFGDAGTGKSSLSFTSESPLLMDFDRGLQRTVGRKASVRFEAWADALNFVEGDTIEKEGIKTLIADTAGTMLDDYLAHHILQMGVKGVDNGAGGLGLRGYGVMKDGFAKFLVACKAKKVDVLFICHSKKEDDGDAKRFFPQLTGGSYDILVSKADLIGYMEMVGEQVTLDFNPTARHTGKNCAGFKKMNLPHFTDASYSDYMAKIIQATKDHMRRQGDSQVKAVALVEQYKNNIIQTGSMSELEKMKLGIEELSPIYKAQVLQTYFKHAAELWSIENIDPAIKTPEEFTDLSIKIKALSKEISSELQETFKKLMDGAGVIYDKASNSFALKANQASAPKPEAKESVVKESKKPVKKTTATPVTAIQAMVRDEQWFIDRIGKKVLMKSEKGLEEISIPDETQAYHLCAVTQKYKKAEFFDLDENPALAESSTANAKESVAQ